MIRHRRQRGYTLLEVVVAMAILAASLGALSESFSLSLRRSQRAANLSRAALLAASVRDRLGGDVALDGKAHGDHIADCSWQVVSHAVARPENESDVYPQAYQSHIKASCGSGSASRQAEVDLFALAGAMR